MRHLDDMTPERLTEILAGFGRIHVAVIGDFFLDKYLKIDPALAEVSVETGKTAHQVAGIRHSPGAAGTVVSNLAALGVGRIHAIGFCGDDGEGFDLRNDLKRLGCSIDHLHREAGLHTPTYLKPHDRGLPGLEGEHSRYDTKNRRPIGDGLQQRLIGSLDALLPQVHAVIVADQVAQPECGAITALVRSTLAERAAGHPGVVFWADSRIRTRLFRGVTIKPNQFEAVGMENPPPGGKIALDRLIEAAAVLRREVGAPVCVTRGPEGMIVIDRESTGVRGVRVAGPIDPTGAGDSATAGAVAALAAGASLPEAALVGNLVASITVEQLGTTGTARPDQMHQRLALWRSQRGA